MVSNCANPGCNARLHYFREGRLYQFETRSEATDIWRADAGTSVRACAKLLALRSLLRPARSHLYSRKGG